MRGESRVTLSFFGEGATEEGVFHESINFASLKKLPVVFVCENNLYSVYTPMSVRQPAHREVFQQAVGHGVEAYQADGNSSRGGFRLTQAAVAKARAGGGPTFLELKTYRWREHCGPNFDNNIGYRTEQEYETWKALCPLTRLRPQLLAKKLMSEADETRWQAELAREIADAVAFAKSSPFPPRSAMTEHLFAV